MSICVLSPHCDDAAISLGSTIHLWTTAGIDVRVMTVFAGDPDSTESPSEWDSKRSQTTAGDVSRVRRREDSIALTLLGATVEWFDLWDDGYTDRPPVDADALAAAIADRIDEDTSLVAPAAPLSHPDHRSTHDAAMVLARMGLATLGYRELPYWVSTPQWRRPSEAPQWRRSRLTEANRLAKSRALVTYDHEISKFGPKSRVGMKVDSVMDLERLTLLGGQWPEEVHEHLR